MNYILFITYSPLKSIKSPFFVGYSHYFFDSSRRKKPTLHLVLVLLLQQVQQGLHDTSAQAQSSSVQLRNVQGQVQKELLSGQLQGGSNEKSMGISEPKMDQNGENPLFKADFGCISEN
jgi:hypothetical protein